MSVLFYISASVALISALVVVTQRNAMRALVNLVVAFLAVACSFWTLGASFAAALQIVVYAGAILVLFLFAVMVLNPAQEEHSRTDIIGWIVPGVLSVALLAEVIVVLTGTPSTRSAGTVGPLLVGRSLFTVYALGVEIASILLLAGLVAAFHYGALVVRSEHGDE